MKRLLALLLLAGLGIGGYYQATGRLPWVFTSPEEQRVGELREDLARIRQQWLQAGRAQTFGMDTGSMAEGPLVRLEKLEKDLAELNATLKTPEARNLAGSLRRDITVLRSEMR